MKKIIFFLVALSTLSSNIFASEFAGIDLGYSMNEAKVEDNTNPAAPTNKYPSFDSVYIGAHMGEYVNKDLRTFVSVRYKLSGRDTINKEFFKDEKIFQVLGGVDYMFRSYGDYIPFIGLTAGFAYHKYTLPRVAGANEHKSAIGLILGPRGGISFDVTGNMDMDAYVGYVFDTASWDRGDRFIKSMKHIELGTSLNYRF